MRGLRSKLQKFVDDHPSQGKLAGFTIIEVLIVLAIAGLIMLIVFLAVPALQRNSRNNQRNNEASRLVAAVTECMANRNTQPSSCNNQSELSPEFIDLASTGQLTAINASETYSLNAAGLVFGRVCDTAGSDSVTGGGSTSFTVTYQLENGIDRCIGS